MIRAALIAACLSAAPVLQALEVGTFDYRFVSDLSANGFQPFGTGGAANVLFGMTNGADIYLCFLLDTPEDQTLRQAALIAELQGKAETKSLPNIPVVCVLTQ